MFYLADETHGGHGGRDQPHHRACRLQHGHATNYN
jgi:hypothetical protein